MHRLFVAIDLPDSVKRSLAVLRSDLPGAHWVAEEQLHLTLRFIGDADDLALAGIKVALEQINAPSFPLALSGIGHFPPGKHPRVFWAGITAPPQLLAVQKQVELCLCGAGIPPEGRKFSPHITIARLKGTPPNRLMAIEEKLKDFSSAPFPVTEFHLYSSTITRSGASHKREATYPLLLVDTRQPA